MRTELCIQQFNIIYFINYTRIVGRLAIKIFVMEEIVGTAARQASVPTDRGYQLLLPHMPLQGPEHAPEEV